MRSVPYFLCILAVVLSNDFTSAQESRRIELVVQNGGGRDVVLSGDGKYVLSGGNLWEAASGRTLRTFPPIEFTGFTREALSGDGKYCVTSGLAATSLWETASGKKLHTFKHKTVSSVALSADGKYVIMDEGYVSTEGGRFVITVWETASGKKLHTIHHKTSIVGGLALSGDGKYFVTGVPAGVNASVQQPRGTGPGTAILWETASGKKLHTLQGHTKDVTKAAICDDGKYFVTLGDDEKAILWEAASGKKLHTLDGHTKKPAAPFQFPPPREVTHIAMSGDGKYVLTGSDDTTAILWEVPSGKKLHTFPGNGAPVTGVALSRDGKRVAVAAYGKVTLWDAGGKKLHTSEQNTRSAGSVRLSHNGKYVVTGTYGRATLWEAASGKRLNTFMEPMMGGNMTVSDDGKFLAHGGALGNAGLWDAASGKKIHTFARPGKDAGPVSVALSGDGKYMVTGLWLGTVTLWETASVKKLHTFQGNAGAVASLALSRDGKFVVTGSFDEKAILWETASGKKLRTFQHNPHVGYVAISGDGKYVVTGGGQDGMAILWETTSGNKLHTFQHKNDVYGVAISGDGKYVATVLSNRTAILWEAASGKKLHELKDTYFNVALSADGKQLWTGAIDGSTRLWDTATGRELCRLIDFQDGSWAVIDPDGRYDASDGGKIDGLHWVAGNEPIALSQLKERFYDPGLLAKHMGFAKEPLRRVEALREVTLFPAVAATTTKDNKLLLNLTNQGGGIGKVEVFVNGRELHADARGAKPDPRKKNDEFIVHLDSTAVKPGEVNNIRVVTWNGEGYLSSRGLEVPWLAPGRKNEQPTELYVIAAGISEYVGDDLKLSFAAKDAADIADALVLGGKRLFGADKVHLRLLCDSTHPKAIAPTREKIEKAFADFRKSRPSDILVVYLAGHGIALNENNQEMYCYLTQEARTTATATFRDQAVRKQTSITSIDLMDWLKQIPANKQVLVLDTCAAGAAASKLMEHRELSADQIRAIDRMRDRTGFQVLMGCAADKVSYESHRYAQGVLTHALLKGMRGAKLQDDEFVDVSLLFQYAADEVPQLAGFVGGIQKPLVLAPRGTSFFVGQLNKDDKKLIPLTTARPQLLQPVLLNTDVLDDDLGLMPLLRKRLADECYVSGRGQGKQPQAVYVAADELPGAIRPIGKYTVAAKKVTATVALRRDGNEVARLTIEGSRDDVPGLATRMAKAIIAKVEKLESP